MINRDDLEAEIMARAVNSAEVKQGLKEFGEAVVAYWRSVSPVRTGKYAASVHVIKRFKADGIPGVKVGSSSHRAALIEYGTGADDKGKKTPGMFLRSGCRLAGTLRRRRSRRGLRLPPISVATRNTLIA